MSIMLSRDIDFLDQDWLATNSTTVLLFPSHSVTLPQVKTPANIGSHQLLLSGN